MLNNSIHLFSYVFVVACGLIHCRAMTFQLQLMCLVTPWCVRQFPDQGLNPHPLHCKTDS